MVRHKEGETGKKNERMKGRREAGGKRRRKSEGGGKERVKATFNGELWSEIADSRRGVP